ncbi:hypothetical protein O6H91_04G126200 [Diphasiastrum complanatum]|uniref:Uncharacterized protein n=1 Tax=Diphasiastrum complanatum TaxID=34168 RepID=A0ACC2E1G3_DIPCM|nr:hypothetical protein O6H91_04G126200 [Diphasiastrum complanatum]
MKLLLLSSFFVFNFLAVKLLQLVDILNLVLKDHKQIGLLEGSSRGYPKHFIFLQKRMACLFISTEKPAMREMTQPSF